MEGIEKKGIMPSYDGLPDPEVKIHMLPHGKGCEPSFAHEGDAGMDLKLAHEKSQGLGPGRWRVFDTGVQAAIPAGFVGLVCPRSGRAAKDGVTTLNGPGVVDSSFRGEIKVILVNHSDVGIIFHPGDRIAQLLIMPVTRPVLQFVDTLDKTGRGSGGLGSTGR
jgi:dUTP pyrophosphatase